MLDALDHAADGTLGQRALVRSVRRTAGTMSVRLGRLERARLIEREPDPGNRRSVTVTITERGRALVSAARPTYLARAQRLVSGLPESAAAALDGWLAYFEPAERETHRLGVAVGTTAMAKRIRSAVGLPEEPGVLVLRVGRDTPAATAGITRGDLITRAAGELVLSTGDLARAVTGSTGRLTLSVLRGAEPHELEVSFAA